MTKRKHREIRQDEILAIAVRLFAEQGYEATTMRQIASSVGLTEGALYKHFNGKQDIFKQSLERIVGLRDQMLSKAAMLNVEDSAGVLKFMAEAALQFVTEGEGQYGFRIILREGVASIEEKGVNVKEKFEFAFNAITALFGAMQQQGGIRRDLRPEFLTKQFAGSVIAAAILKIVTSKNADELEFPALFEQGLDVFLHGAHGSATLSNLTPLSEDQGSVLP